jgi:hypothetical protein
MPVIYFMVNFPHFVKNILEKAYFVSKKKIVEEKKRKFLQKKMI